MIVVIVGRGKQGIFTMKQRIGENSIQHQFDVYYKKVIRNEAKNIRTRNSRIHENEKTLNYIEVLLKFKFKQQKFPFNFLSKRILIFRITRFF